MQFPTDPFGFFELFGTLALLFTIVPLIICVIFIIVGVKACQSSSTASRAVATYPTFTVQRPFAPGRADGADIRTVRLPVNCPSCGAAISQGSVDWVGPLEAKCSYCGATIKAQFERI